MKRVLASLFVLTLFGFSGSIQSARAEGVGQEAAEHPRIVTAIRELETAVKYLEAAPHNFGGHKAAAIAASRAAIAELNKALLFRAVVDTKRGK